MQCSLMRYDLLVTEFVLRIMFCGGTYNNCSFVSAFMAIVNRRFSFTFSVRRSDSLLSECTEWLRMRTTLSDIVRAHSRHPIHYIHSHFLSLLRHCKGAKVYLSGARSSSLVGGG